MKKKTPMHTTQWGAFLSEVEKLLITLISFH